MYLVYKIIGLIIIFFKTFLITYLGRAVQTAVADRGWSSKNQIRKETLGRRAPGDVAPNYSVENKKSNTVRRTLVKRGCLLFIYLF